MEHHPSSMRDFSRKIRTKFWAWARWSITSACCLTVLSVALKFVKIVLISIFFVVCCCVVRCCVGSSLVVWCWWMLNKKTTLCFVWLKLRSPSKKMPRSMRERDFSWAPKFTKRFNNQIEFAGKGRGKWKEGKRCDTCVDVRWKDMYLRLSCPRSTSAAVTGSYFFPLPSVVFK